MNTGGPMVPEPATAPVSGMSEFARITGVFFEPSKAFADIARRPHWILPTALIVLMALAFSFAVSRRVGWDRTIRQTLESNDRIQALTPEQRERTIEQGAKIAGTFAYAGAIVATPISIALIAAVLLFIFNTLGGAGLTYNQMLAITAYAFLTALLSVALSILVLYLKSPDDFNLQNPLAFNIGAFLDPTSTPKWLIAIGRSFDLFTFWRIALLAIGVSVASRKISFSKALAGVVIPWAAIVAIGAGWAAFFG